MGDGTRLRERAAAIATVGVAVLAAAALGAVLLAATVLRPPAPTVLSPAPAVPDPCAPAWTAAWQASPQAVVPAEPLAGRTLRMIARPQVTGAALRVRLSNRFGTDPLPVAAVTAARAGAGPALLPGTVREVTFGGAPTATVPPGSELVSDPVAVAAEAGRPVAVSLVLPRTPAVVAEHPIALQTSYVSGPGDATRDADGAAFTTAVGSWMVVTGVDVLAPRPVNAVVAMGDSITDGVGSAGDTDSRLTDALFARLAQRGGATAMAVLNAGIARNELLADRGTAGGDTPLRRMGREVLDVPGVTDVVLHAGTNDVAAGRGAAEIVAGLVRFADAARAGGLRVYLTTITPSDRGPRGTPQALAAREQVNRWVREHGAEHADGVFDFAGAVADPADPARLRDRFDAGDGLHLSGAGYRALADAVDVTRLSGSPCLAGGTAARVVLAGR